MLNPSENVSNNVVEKGCQLVRYFEVLTPDQGYLMDQTFICVHGTVCSQTPFSSSQSQPTPFLLNIRSVPSPTVKLDERYLITVTVI